MANKKFYAVAKGQGRTPEIYTDWTSCKNAVSGFKGTIYKGFESREEAIGWLALQEQISRDELFSKYSWLNKGQSLENRIFAEKSRDYDVEIYVDGSFKEGINAYGYGFVFVKDGVVLLQEKGHGSKPEAVKLRNVSGEMLGTVKAVLKAAELEYKSIAIHYDYQGVASWALGTWKRNNIHTESYHEFMQKILKVMKIDFIKVDAHSGHVYNDMADQLAKDGLKTYTEING